MKGDVLEYFVVQYRPTAHDPWKDDNLAHVNLERAVARLERASSAKIYKGAQWRIVKRTDTEI